MMLQMVVPTKMQTDIITTEAGVTALADEWRELYARASRTPFSDFDLFSVWWQVIGKMSAARRLHIVTGRIDGKLVAVLPLIVMHQKGLRILQAAGYKAYNCCDMLAENRDQAVALWQAARCSRYYDFADIRDVGSDSMCGDVLASFARRRDKTPSFYLKIKWSTGKEWISSLISHTRGNFNRCMRRLEEKGPLRFQTYEGGPLPMAIIDGMVKLKVAWSAERKARGVFEYAEVPEYYRQLIKTMAQKGSLFLSWLQCGDDVVAYNQGYIHQGVLHMAFWTHDPAYARHSPGNVVLINSLCWAIDHGLRGVDLRQGESQLKRKYSNEKHHCAEFTFCGSLRGRLIEAAYMAARTIMRIFKIGASQAAAQED